MSTTLSNPFDENDGHPDLVRFGRTALATFNATVTASRMFHPASIHPDIAELDAVYGRKFAIIGDWMVKQVKAGWPLEKVRVEMIRRLRNAEAQSEAQNGGVQ